RSPRSENRRVRGTPRQARTRPLRQEARLLLSMSVRGWGVSGVGVRRGGEGSRSAAGNGRGRLPKPGVAGSNPAAGAPRSRLVLVVVLDARASRRRAECRRAALRLLPLLLTAQRRQVEERGREAEAIGSARVRGVRVEHAPAVA